MKHTPEHFLHVEGLTKAYSAFRLEEISFDLETGYIMGYVGPNGAGKTTTLNLLTHLIRADSGQILLDGISYEQDPVAYRDMIGYIGDSSYFPERMNRLQIAGILRDFYPSFDPQRFRQLCEQWKLPEKERVRTYSRGMRVKLMFASVLSRTTKLMVLDEATNGLDPMMRLEILDLLREYIEDGEKSVIFSTHIMEDLADIADHIFLIDQGQKICFETKEELLERYVLVKGGLEALTGPQISALTGVMKNAYGFEALYDTQSGLNLPAGLVTERPAIDQVVVHLLEERRKG